MITIQESNRYTELIQFFIENELEFTEDQKQIPDTVVKYWEALDGEKLVGGCVLGMREGAYVLEGIATDAGYRKKRMGERLLGRDRRPQCSISPIIFIVVPRIFGDHLIIV